ncbi:MAG: phage portal protein [Oscillospiraceae bacterium]|nr:phage portal protein [Oscillospiraceae bacterium]
MEAAEVVVSKRFVNPETGEPELWKIKPITAKQHSALRRACMTSEPVPGGKKGQYTQQLDSSAYQAKMCAACTLYPDLNNTELQNSYGVMGAEALIATMLTPGEFEDYSTKVLEFNGFSTKNELVEEAKN